MKSIPTQNFTLMVKALCNPVVMLPQYAMFLRIKTSIWISTFLSYVSYLSTWHHNVSKQLTRTPMTVCSFIPYFLRYTKICMKDMYVQTQTYFQHFSWGHRDLHSGQLRKPFWFPSTPCTQLPPQSDGIIRYLSNYWKPYSLAAVAH